MVFSHWTFPVFKANGQSHTSGYMYVPQVFFLVYWLGIFCGYMGQRKAIIFSEIFNSILPERSSYYEKRLIRKAYGLLYRILFPPKHFSRQCINDALRKNKFIYSNVKIFIFGNTKLVS